MPRKLLFKKITMIERRKNFNGSFYNVETNPVWLNLSLENVFIRVKASFTKMCKKS